MKNTIIVVVILIILGIGGYLLTRKGPEVVVKPNEDQTTPPPPVVVTPPSASSTEAVKDPSKTVIGKSVEGNNLTAYHYPPTKTESTRDTEILFVGGIHGGYSWNTTLVAYELMDYLEKTPTAIPSNVKVTVIPSLNPDGQKKTVGTTERFTKAAVPTAPAERISGRFNANNVDLNRNFDCDWQAEGVWQTKKVSGGTAVFSEPESLAIQKYVEENKPDAVIVWYSAAGGVFASNCHNGVLAETKKLTSLFAKASGYKEYNDFDFYEITGDMVNWLAKKNIPAISVLLTDHENTEWSKNKAGIDALLKNYAK